MPEISPDRRSYRCKLRDDLYFAADSRIPENCRKVTAGDVKFSILRIADARNHSPVYWIYRNRISGIGEFRRRSAGMAKGDMSIYDEEISGIKIISDREFILTLDEPDPGFLFLLAMPNAAVVSRRAALASGENGLTHRPAGSGPFVLEMWVPNLKLRFLRNPDYRTEYFPQAADPADRTRKLPLLDAVEICQVRQMMTQWMLFLQGNLDRNALDKDNSETLAAGGEILPALAERGVILEKHQEFEIRYIGFNFRDPLLGKNLKLRQALRAAYNIPRRISHASGMLIPAAGPVPSGIAGHIPAPAAVEPDYEKIAALLAEAGFSGGIDPATGEALKFTFDQAGSTVNHRQMGELAADDWRKIGIQTTARLNSRPLFAGNLRRGKFQIFRYSWVGDYPDAANFLQLFYSKNIGSCNYCGYADEEFDRMYETAAAMPDCPERTELYCRMVRHLNEQCVWIYEGFPVSGVLSYNWLENSVPHDFNFTRWKYLSVDVAKRERMKKSFRPLSLGELAAGGAGNE
jgi:ABC-type transport system substrate-binding protein